MNQLICASDKPLRSHLALAGAALCLCACASKTALHEQERARYAELESELIRNQQVTENRRQSDYRVSRLQQLNDSDPVLEENSDQNAFIDNETTEVVANEYLPSQSARDQPNASLPFVIGQTTDELDSPVWQLQKYPDPVSGLPLCAAVSRTEVARNGTLETNVNIIVSSNAVFLRTDAVFDTEARETGYRIDAGFPIPFDQFANELTAVVEENHSRLAEAMLAGTTLSVAFAYSPQLSSANTHVLELSLDSFSDAWLELIRCNEQKQPDATSLKDEPTDT